MEALASVLQAYAGTVLFVSHDRRFISQVATSVLAVEGRQIVSFTGSYVEYQARKSAKRGLAENLLVLENRLAEISGRLAMPGPNDDPAALEREFMELAAQIRRLKSGAD